MVKVVLNGITKNEKWRNIMVTWCNDYKLTVHQTTWNFIALNELNLKGRHYYWVDTCVLCGITAD